MNGYKISSDVKKFLKLNSKCTVTNASEAGEETIKKFNSNAINKKALKKLYKPKKENISKKTFIIPTEDGNSIASYLFTKNAKNSDASKALIIYFHNGGWILGNMEIANAICSNICKETGASVLAVDYRIAPDCKFPTPVEDCYEAFVWAANGAKYWRIDPNRIYLMGSCCGGTIAAAVSILARDRKGPKIAGQILIDPITDGRLRTESITRLKDNPILKEKDLIYFINNYQTEPKDILNPLFSPLLAIDNSRLPETLVISEEFDPLIDDGRLYAEALAQADTKAKFFEIPSAFHGFMNVPSGKKWRKYMEIISAFVSGQTVTSLSISNKKKTERPIIV